MTVSQFNPIVSSHVGFRLYLLLALLSALSLVVFGCATANPRLYDYPKLGFRVVVLPPGSVKATCAQYGAAVKPSGLCYVTEHHSIIVPEGAAEALTVGLCYADGTLSPDTQCDAVKW